MRSASWTASTGRCALLCAILLAGITGNATADPAQFQLSSPAFSEGGAIPAHFTCDEKNVSPPLVWTDPPPGTKSFALVIVDIDAPDPKAPVKPWVHWVVYSIPPDVRSLDEGASRKLPAGARHGRNDWKTPDYGGPCPSVGRHRYVHKLYALDLPPTNLGSPSHAILWSRVEPSVLGRATLTGTYERPAAAQRQP